MLHIDFVLTRGNADLIEMFQSNNLIAIFRTFSGWNRANVCDTQYHHIYG